MSVPGLPALDNTMGALFIGIVLCMGLWGASTVQMYYYFNKYVNDDWKLKTFVVVVWALDTVHQALITHSGYIYLITQYGNPLFLEHLESTLLDMVVFSAIICVFVQGFLLLRVWRLSHHNYIISGILGVIIVGQFIATLVYYGKAYKFQTFIELQTVYPISKSINVVSAVSDAAIAATLIFYLQRSRTGFSRSETIINRLIALTVNTGLLTGLCAIASLATVTALPLTFVYIVFYLLTSRLYANSLFAVLNARTSISGRMHEDTETGSNSVSLNRLRARPVDVEASTYGLDKSKSHMVSINVNTETTDDMVKGPVVSNRSESDLETAYPPSNKGHF